MGLETLVFIRDEKVLNALSPYVRVNKDNKTVEIYNEYGVKLVLRDLEESVYDAFVSVFATDHVIEVK